MRKLPDDTMAAAADGQVSNGRDHRGHTIKGNEAAGYRDIANSGHVLAVDL